jgi:ActR/RegA family two-component response regulator
MNSALDILLVEDDEVFASVLQRSLLRRGHRVQWAVDAAAARNLPWRSSGFRTRFWI